MYVLGALSLSPSANHLYLSSSTGLDLDRVLTAPVSFENMRILFFLSFTFKGEGRSKKQICFVNANKRIEQSLATHRSFSL